MKSHTSNCFFPPPTSEEGECFELKPSSPWYSIASARAKPAKNACGHFLLLESFTAPVEDRDGDVGTGKSTATVSRWVGDELAAGIVARHGSSSERRSESGSETRMVNELHDHEV